VFDCSLLYKWIFARSVLYVLMPKFAPSVAIVGIIILREIEIECRDNVWIVLSFL
jgi:hypothetical protein